MKKYNANNFAPPLAPSASMKGIAIMRSDQVSRLAKIKDEVSELHPLLRKLLPNLPRVLETEYTHGTGEMGADLVIRRQGDTFQNDEYIGVIAKVGKIVQDFSELERQIDECAIPRFFSGGKEKIRIDEVWVIITDNITKGAQEKIHDKYKSRKIVFVTGVKLEKLIDEYFPVYWTDVDLEIGAYLSDLRARNQEADRRMSLLPIQDKSFYIEPDIYRRERTTYKSNLQKSKDPIKIDIHKEIEGRDLIFIEGWMGLGKSKLIRELTNHYTTPEVYKTTSLLPVQTTFKELLDDFGGDIRRLIEQKTLGHLLLKPRETQYLLLIDGVDEKDLPVDEQATALARLVEDVHKDPNIRAVICSRYVKALEQSAIFRGEDYAYEIRPLTLEKTVAFLRAICTRLNVRDRVVEDLKKSPLFKELPRSPISAILLSKLLNENAQDLPSNMTELYSKYLELMLGRWDIMKGLQMQKEYRALDNIMMQLATHMIKNELSFLSIEDTKQIFRDFLKRKNFGINADDLFQKAMDRCEILASDSTGNTVVFKHRTFAEYFYAKSLAKKPALQIDNRALQLYWTNIFFFYLGILQDCHEELNQLVNLQPVSEQERWVKLVNMANYLLAGYTTDYSTISDGISKMMIEASQLYLDTVAGKSDTPFKNLSRMANLYILQGVVRNSYSYEFFLQAIEDAALVIDSSDHTEELKTYALFFLSVILIELGQKASFDFLLKSHLGRLPIDVSVALMIEEKRLDDRSVLLKKQDKHIKKLFKGNRPLKDIVKGFFERPIALTKSARIQNVQ